MATSLSKLQIQSLVSDLEGILQMIEGGKLSATSSMKHRVEGAIAALKVVEGEAEGVDII